MSSNIVLRARERHYWKWMICTSPHLRLVSDLYSRSTPSTDTSEQ